MSVSLQKFVQQQLEGSEEWLEVSRRADLLCDHLNTPEATARIAEANQPGRSSADVQAAFGDFARDLGFENERSGLFANLELALRPDYFRRVGSSGVLLEVERGKTTINNTDLLSHACTHAQYLFLLVPVALRQNPTMSPRNEFATVAGRLA
jgi:hypothetical protein